MESEDAFSSAIVTINEQGIIQSVDKNCCNLFGYTPENLLNQKVQILIPPPYKEQHDSYLKNYHETGVAKIIGKSRVVEGLHSSGAIFPILLSISNVTVGGTKLYVAMIDKLEDKAGIITTNMQGIVVSCNHHCENLFGYKVNELVGQKLNMLLPPPYCDLHDGYIERYHQTGEQKVIGKIRNLVAKHKNGVVFPISLQVFQIKIGVVDLFRARIDRLDTDIEAVFTLNEEGIICSCNKNFVLPFFGYTDGELIGQHINKLFVSFYSKISAPEASHPVKRRKTNGEISFDEFKLKEIRTAEVIHKDGSTFPVSVAVNRFNQDNVCMYAIKIRRMPEGQGSSSSSEPSLARSNGVETNLDIVGDWILGEKIGQGSYGRVKLATHKDSGLKAAVKILQLDMMDDPEIDRSKREIEIMKQLNHPNICKVLDVVETADRLYIIMELGAGELQGYQKTHTITEDVARKFFGQILDAIEYCHSRNIIHRDIKHKNILLDENDNVKLIDFGLSNFTSGGLRSTFCGTPAYAAPEMILGKKYIGPEVDVWSMGVVLYSMLCSKFPFRDVGTIIAGKYRTPRTLSPACIDLLKIMLTIDPTQRATTKQIRDHPWIQGKEISLPEGFQMEKEIDEEDDHSGFDSSEFKKQGGCPVAHITSTVTYNAPSNGFESPTGGGCPVMHIQSQEPPKTRATGGGCPVAHTLNSSEHMFSSSNSMRMVSSDSDRSTAGKQPMEVFTPNGTHSSLAASPKVIVSTTTTTTSTTPIASPTEPQNATIKTTETTVTTITPATTTTTTATTDSAVQQHSGD